MAYQFTKDLETGNSVIDSEHRQLIAAVNSLLDACSKGQGRTQLSSTANFLLNYTEKHFAYEEAIQSKNHCHWAGTRRTSVGGAGNACPADVFFPSLAGRPGLRRLQPSAGYPSSFPAGKKRS